MHLSLSLIQSTSLFCALMLLLCTHVTCDSMKLNSCCTKTSSYPITTHITSCRFQRASHHCVKAVIFTSEGQHFCSYPKAPWVAAMVKELHRNGIACTSIKAELV